MSTKFNFGDQSIFVYRFPGTTSTKVKLLESFLNEFFSLCKGQLIESIDEIPVFQLPRAIVLFLVSDISNFDTLLNLHFPESAVKVVAYFFSEEEFQKVNDKCFRSPFKARFFRVIYPDQVTALGLRFPSVEKVLDTIYARTIRNKFNTVNLGHNIQSFTHIDPRSAIADIIQMGWYLRDMGLNHSDSAAGGIALRFGHGILVTASKTDKYQIDHDRICYLEDYISEHNIVKFIGNYPPSSESALAYHTFQEFPLANLILHFHYKPMTCAQKLQDYRTEKYISYGTFAEAKAVADKFRETPNFVIANGHGEFILASNFVEAKATVNRILSML
jgi:Class II Aldolase and Adducin N-terminal domain